MKIISTVPSITELLADLGLDKETIGITKFCVHPKQWYKSKTRIGGTKALDLDKINALNPTLIIANKEENVKEQIENLKENFEVMVTDIKSPEDNLDLITELASKTDKRMTGLRLRNELNEAILSLQPKHLKTCAYLIWQKPYMTVGGDTYINSVLEKCGFVNVFEDELRYPDTCIRELRELKPEYILLSSEPFPFRKKQLDAIQLLLPDSKVLLVDGEVFSWYGTRLIKKVDYMVDFIKSTDIIENT